MRVISERWSILSKRARLFAGAFGAVLLFAVAAGFLVQRDTRIALFAEPLRGEQVAEVADRLAEWNEPFVVAVDNVRVEAKRRNALLLRLSLAQVPHPHLASSSEVLANASPLTPQAVLDAEQRDGLAGDIAGSLRGLAGVEDARVIIAPAREGAFAGEKSHDATASVRLNLKAGAALSRETLEGIRNFVAAGVPGLNAPHVAILDDRGLTLGEQSPVRTGEAQGLQNSLQSALDAVVGGAATIVRVRVDYDPRNLESHAVVRRPLGSRPVATTSADERYKSPSKQYAKSTTTIDRGSETRDEKIDTPAGRLERISVAVAVDQARHLDIPKIRSLATGTLGLVSSRGDVLSVEEMVFPQTAAVRSLPLAAGLGLAASLAPSRGSAGAARRRVRGRETCCEPCGSGRPARIAAAHGARGRRFRAGTRARCAAKRAAPHGGCDHQRSAGCDGNCGTGNVSSRRTCGDRLPYVARRSAGRSGLRVGVAAWLSNSSRSRPSCAPPHGRPRQISRAATASAMRAREMCATAPPAAATGNPCSRLQLSRARRRSTGRSHRQTSATNCRFCG